MTWESYIGLIINILIALGTLWAAREAAKAAKGSENASISVQRQIEIAESTRKVQILPYIVVHSLKENTNRFSTYLIIENVGLGAAINVRIKILKGENYRYAGLYLSDYSPIKNGISVLPPNTKLDTILGSNLAL